MVSPVARTILTFSVIGDDLDPDELTALLSFEPTHAHRKGDPIVGRDGTVNRHASRGIWQFRLHADSRLTTPAELLEEPLDKLHIGSDAWPTMVSRFQLDATCALFMASPNEGLVLPPELCERIVAAGITLGFDRYATENGGHQYKSVRPFRMMLETYTDSEKGSTTN